MKQHLCSLSKPLNASGAPAQVCSVIWAQQTSRCGIRKCLIDISWKMLSESCCCWIVMWFQWVSRPQRTNSQLQKICTVKLKPIWITYLTIAFCAIESMSKWRLCWCKIEEKIQLTHMAIFSKLSSSGYTFFPPIVTVSYQSYICKNSNIKIKVLTFTQTQQPFVVPLCTLLYNFYWFLFFHFKSAKASGKGWDKICWASYHWMIGFVEVIGVTGGNLGGLAATWVVMCIQ